MSEDKDERKKPEDYKRVYPSLLAKAIAHKSDGNMSMGEAEESAERALNFFGFDNRTLDNILDKEDRDLFYSLEDKGLLKTERETTELYDGREWRSHYWLLDEDEIYEASENYGFGELNEEKDVYNEVPEEVWVR